jgi:hypothetical protein
MRCGWFRTKIVNGVEVPGYTVQCGARAVRSVRVYVRVTGLVGKPAPADLYLCEEHDPNRTYRDAVPE